MKRLVLALAVLSCACRSTPDSAHSDAPASPEYFGPESNFQEPAPTVGAQTPPEDFDWWTRAPLTQHRIAEASDDEYWLLWEGAVALEDPVRFSRIPAIFFFPLRVEEHELVEHAAGPADTIDDMLADMWLSLGPPFNPTDVYETPSYRAGSRKPYQRVYLTEEHAIVTLANGSLGIIMQPEMVRRGEIPDVPEAFSAMYQQAARPEGSYNWEVTLLFPSYQLAIPRRVTLYNNSSDWIMTLYEKPW